MSSEVDCVLLPVDDLDAAKRRYRRLLRPLDYIVVGESQHRRHDGYGSRTVQFGPANTSRVDLVLSESDLPREQRRNAHATQDVIFPAMQRHVVRDFYADALENGFNPKQAPFYDQDSGALTTSVFDVDGNTITVRFDAGNDPPSEAPVTGGIDNWISGVATSRVGDSNPANTTDIRSVPPYAQAHAAPPPSSFQAPLRPRRTSSTTSAASSHHSGRRTSSSSGVGVIDSFIPSSGKAVVGTLIGAAAGAALAYGVISSRSDSKAREAEFNERERERENLRSEARSNRYSQPMPNFSTSPQSNGIVDRAHETDRKGYYYSEESRPRRYADRDRDSGYNSGSSAGRSPPDWYDKPVAAPALPPAPGLKYRSTTFPQPAPSFNTQRSYRDRAANLICSSDRDRISEASESTIRPMRRGSVRLIPPKPPASLPGSMLPPSVPGMSSKRGGSVTNAPPPPAASALHSRELARGRSRSHDRLSRAQTEYGAYDDRERRRGSEPARRTHSLSTSRRKLYRYDGHGNDDNVDNYFRGAPARRDGSDERDGRSSTHTARRVDLPPSESGYTVRTVKTADRSSRERDGDGRSSMHTARFVPLPASEAGRSTASKLTAKNLESVNRSAASGSRAGGRGKFDTAGRDDGDVGLLDELGSVAPGDSISVVGHRGVGAGERRSRTTAGSGTGRSRTSGGSRR